MAKTLSLRKAFASFGAVAKNPRWSWSARSPDGKTVVINLWSDERYWLGPGRYREPGHDDLLWAARPGNRDRLENLIWARNNCGHLFRVVITVGVAGAHSEIADCWPHPDLLMHIDELDEKTGAFEAHHVGNQAASSPLTT